MTHGNVEDEFDVILSRQCLFHLAQCYEILESYLYNQVTNFILASPVNLPNDFKPKENTFSAVRAALKRIKRRTENRHLLTILRNNLPSFNANEITNLYGVDFTKWYHLLSLVRDCVTHKRMKLTLELKREFNEVHNTIFKTYTDADGEIILLTDSEARALISRIAEYIFLVYKSVTEKSLGIEVNFSSIQHIYKDIHS